MGSRSRSGSRGVDYRSAYEDPFSRRNSKGFGSDKK